MAEFIVPIATGIALSALSAILSPKPEVRSQEPQVRLTGSEYGRGIPYIYGKAKIAANYIWPREIKNAYRREVRRSGGGKGGGNRSATREILIYGSWQSLFCEGPVNFEELIVQGKKMAGGGADSEWADAFVTYFSGQPNQSPWSIAEGKEGSGNVPGYRGLALVAVNDLLLSKSYSNQIPVQFTAVVSNQDFPQNTNLGLILIDLFKKAGYSEDKIEAGELTDIPISGYILSNTGSEYRQSIDELLLAFQAFICELPDGTISLRKWERPTGESVWIIPPYLFGVTSGSDQMEGSALYKKTVIDNVTFPTRLAVSFFNSDLDYEKDTSAFAEYPTIERENEEIFDTQIVMTASEALTMATRLLSQAWTRRYKYEFTLDPSLVSASQLTIGTIIRIPITEELVQIDKITIGRDFVIEIEAYLYKPAIYSLVNTVIQTPREIPKYKYPDPSIIYSLDTGLIQDTDIDNGIYFATNHNEVSAFVSDDDIEYQSVDVIDFYTSIGTVQGSFGGGVSSGLIDRKNTLEVLLSKGSLESINANNLKKGNQLAFIGKIIDGYYQGEIIGFQDAQLIGDKRYRLSVFLRGLKGSDGFINNHTNDEIFLLLKGNESFVIRQSYQIEEIGSTRFFKGIRDELEINGFTTIPSTSTIIKGTAYKPFAPTSVRLKRIIGDNTLVLSWVPRYRKNTVWVNNSTPVSPEGTDRFEVIIDGGSPVIITGTEYTFQSINTSVNVTITQLSSVVGKGYPFVGTIAVTRVI